MKICWVLCCLVAITRASNVGTHQPVQPRFINPNAVLRQVFEMLRFLIKNGNKDMVPVLDPLEFKYHTFEIKLPNKLLTLKANFTNGILEGLGDFEVKTVEFIKSEIAIDVSINIPLLNLTAEHYEMEGNIYEIIPLAGYGRFEYKMLNFRFWTKIYLKQSTDGQSILIDRFHDSQFSIEKILSQTEFDENIDNIFNALTEDLLADYLTRFSKSILMKYSDNALKSINPFLNEFETWRFIAAIL